MSWGPFYPNFHLPVAAQPTLNDGFPTFKVTTLEWHADYLGDVEGSLVEQVVPWTVCGAANVLGNITNEWGKKR